MAGGSLAERRLRARDEVRRWATSSRSCATTGCCCWSASIPTGPLGGIACTLILSVLGLVLAFPLERAAGAGARQPWRLLNWPATALVYVVRGVPLHHGDPLGLLPGAAADRPAGVAASVTMLVTLVIYEGAYLAEIVRAGIESLPRGQMEAARAVGLSVHAGAMRKVILPQAHLQHGAQRCSASSSRRSRKPRWAMSSA